MTNEITTAQAAKESGLTQGYIRRLMRQGVLTGRKEGRGFRATWYVSSDSFSGYMKNRNGQNDGTPDQS